MSHDGGQFFLDHLHEMSKRAACVRFGLEAYTIGVQDGFAGRLEDNGYTGAAQRRDYAQGYRVGYGTRPVKMAESGSWQLRRGFGDGAVWQ